MPGHRRRWVKLAVTGACAGLAWLFISFASEVRETETGSFDRAVAAWVNAHQHPAAYGFFSVATWLGAKEVLAPLAIIVGLLLARGRRRKAPVLMLLTPVVIGFLLAWLKDLYGIERPPAGVAARLGSSFPSGHTAGSTAAAIVVSFVWYRERAASSVVFIPAALVALLVGCSRVYLGLHWASDVLGGWVVGTLIGVSVCALYEWVRVEGRAGVASSRTISDRSEG